MSKTEPSPHHSTSSEHFSQFKSQLYQLVESLSANKERIGFDIIAESYLSRLGALEPLKASGILPPEDVNPFDPATSSEKYNQWWDEHPDVDPWENQEQHEEVLRLIYIGTQIGFLAGKHFKRVPLQRIDIDDV